MKRVFITLLFCTLTSVLFGEGEFNLPMMVGFDYQIVQQNTVGVSTNRVGDFVSAYYFGGATNRYEQNMSTIRHEFGVFFDMYYARVDMKYWFEVAPLVTYVYSNNTAYITRDTTVGPGSVYYPAKGYNVNGMDISFLLKLPFRTSESYKIYKSNVWIGAGLEYSINFNYDPYQMGRNEYAYGDHLERDGRDLNDLFGLIALGATVDVNERIVLVPKFTFGYNFTPFPVTDDYIKYYFVDTGTYKSVQDYKDDHKITVYKFELDIGLAFKF